MKIPVMSRILSTLLLLSITVSLCAQKSFKRIGYVPFHRVNMVEQLDFKGLSHLNIAFANPDDYGNLHTKDYDYSPMVKKAHSHNVDVFISLAGGGLPKDISERWETLMDPFNRSWFISKIKDYVLRNGLQGADMDLEWGDVNRYYSDFILEMKDTFDVYELGLTVALPAVKRFSPITDEALKAFDWINMMVYDARGPWDPNNPGQHSSYEFALEAIEFWKGEGIPAEKLVLGVPFYGYDFSKKSKVRSVYYADMIAKSSTNAFLDARGSIYYNGINTILAKLKIAYDELGGIMMWELSQDAPNAFSLWKNIRNELQLYELEKKSTAQSCSPNPSPNPFTEAFILDLKEDLSGYAKIYDTKGNVIYTENFRNKKLLNIKPLNIPDGIFVVDVVSKSKTLKYKLVKQSN